MIHSGQFRHCLGKSLDTLGDSPIPLGLLGNRGFALALGSRGYSGNGALGLGSDTRDNPAAGVVPVLAAVLAADPFGAVCGAGPY